LWQNITTFAAIIALSTATRRLSEKKNAVNRKRKKFYVCPDKKRYAR
jgi:hypothetical protein